MLTVSLDLETVPCRACPAPPPPPDGPPRLPAPVHHEIVVGAWATLDGYRVTALDYRSGEIETVAAIVAALSQAEEVRLVTWNGRRFDVPVLAARCLRHGVPFPAWRALRGRGGRHVDLCAEISDHGAAPPARLDQAARLLGLPGKLEGVDGASVEQTAREERYEEIVNYCLADVTQTTAIYLRWGLLVGEIRAEEYDEAVERLLDVVASEPRLEALREAIRQGDDGARLRRTVSLPEAYLHLGPPCPSCGGTMARRSGPRGQFWGCLGYPACRGTREIERGAESGQSRAERLNAMISRRPS